MRPSHKQFAPQYASMFGDASVVHAYQYRPPYPPETFEMLISLLDPDAALRTVRQADILRLWKKCWSRLPGVTRWASSVSIH